MLCACGCGQKTKIAHRFVHGHNMWGSGSHLWKGDNASYGSFHKRLRRRKGSPQKCSVCGTADPTKRYEWANLSGDYANLNDYKRMCAKCHRRFDHKRKKTCRNGHLRNAETVYVAPNGRRACKICRLAAGSRYRRKMAEDQDKFSEGLESA